jgi:phosphohistidine swiveling domain-containing protein
VGLVVGCRAIAHHGHDVGERHAGAVVLVCIDEDAETLEAVG